MNLKTYKKTDLLILSQLRQNARMKLTEMSRKTSIPVSTLFDKIRSYQDNGLVDKHAALVKFEKLGYQRVLITFACRKGNRVKLLEFLERHKSLNSLYKINNGWDFMAEMLFSSVKEVEEFLDELDDKVKVKKKRVFYIVNDLKKEKFLTNSFLLEAD